MHRNERLGVLFVCLSAISWGGCSALDKDENERIEIDQDLREYARQARANLALLTPERRAIVEPILTAHERAIARHDDLLARGETRRAAQAPLYGTGIYLIANDATGVGVADDVALPFVALGLIAVALLTNAPASSGERNRAYRRVLDSGRDVTQVFHASSSDGSTITAEPGTREYCIDLYVDCQMNAAKRFNRSRCQTCMDRCIVNEYEWPDEKQCRYKEDEPRLRDHAKGIKVKI